MRNPLLFFLFLALLTGCKKFADEHKKECFIPYVDFVVHVNPSTLEATFKDTVQNGTVASYKWDFGDGTTYSGSNPPPHQYPPPASTNGLSHYKVKLTVANGCGEAFWTQDVTIAGCLPDTKFSFRYLNDSTVEFSNQTKSPSSVNYSWSFGDGTTGTNSEATFTHVYKEDRPFTVSLKAINDCGENNYSETIAVCRKTEASQTVSSTQCGVVNINASASKNAATYKWDFGNGAVLSSASSTASYTYPNSGTYTIKLTVYNSSGCDSATTSNNIAVAASSLGSNNQWSYTSNDLDFNFTRAPVTNAASYKWDFGDGTSSTLQSPAHSFGNPGTYAITLSASNSCGATYKFSVQLNAPYYKTLDNIPSTGFQQVLVFSPSLIYFLGTNGKLYSTDTAGNWSQPINLPSELSFNSNTKLYKDVNNNLWIYGKKEVAKFSGNGTWASYFPSNTVSKNAIINSIAVDGNNILWLIANGELIKENHAISRGLQFSSLTYSEKDQRIWLTYSGSNNLFYADENSSQINRVNTSGITGGGDEIKINSSDEIYVATATGIVRTNSSGNTISIYNSGSTNGIINSRPSEFDFDAQGNLWVVISGQLFKLPVANSSNSKKYSFNADLDNISSISVLNLSGTDSDILLAKTSGNAAIKIR